MSCLCERTRHRCALIAVRSLLPTPSTILLIADNDVANYVCNISNSACCLHERRKYCLVMYLVCISLSGSRPGDVDRGTYRGYFHVYIVRCEREPTSHSCSPPPHIFARPPLTFLLSIHTSWNGTIFIRISPIKKHAHEQDKALLRAMLEYAPSNKGKLLTASHILQSVDFRELIELRYIARIHRLQDMACC